MIRLFQSRSTGDTNCGCGDASPPRPGFDEYELGMVLTPTACSLLFSDKTSHTLIGLCSRTSCCRNTGRRRTTHLDGSKMQSGK